jgi:hypothetical protein
MQKWEICTLSWGKGIVDDRQEGFFYSVVAYTPIRKSGISESIGNMDFRDNMKRYEERLVRLLDDGWEPIQVEAVAPTPGNTPIIVERIHLKRPYDG